MLTCDRDQELRFTVHDSPDYYQLKISVFNDDKKTELIGEAWIDLRDIIVTGGGQNDLWHQLTCRGKYAGDIRIEITFYDSRPKPDKPAVKAKPSVSSELNGAPRPGPGKPAGPKRRPLPNDPLTGKAPPSQPALEPMAQTPPRPQPNPPLSYIPNQSPLQQMEYNNTPPPGPRYQDQYSSAQASPSVYGGPPQQMDLPPQQYRTPERHETYHHYDERNGSPGMQIPSYERLHQQPPQGRDDMYHVDERGVSPEDDRPPPPPVHRSRHNSGPAAHEQMVVRNGYDGLPPKGTPPTIRHEVLRNEAHRHSQSVTSMSGAYPGQPTYRPYNPASSSTSQIPQYSSPGEVHHPSPPRHQSYDSAYDAHHRSMQPTVEDVPESPDQFTNSFRRSGSRMPQYESPTQSRYEPEYEQTASPAPLNLHGRGSSTSLNQYNPSPTQGERHRRHSSINYDLPEQSQPSRDYQSQDHYQTPPPSKYLNDRGQQMLPYHGELDDTSGNYGTPPVPSSLVPGIDQSLAMEINYRINEDRRNDRRYTQPPMAPSPNDRDRQSYGGHDDYGNESPSAGYGSSQYSRGRSSQNYSAPPLEYPASAQPSGYSSNPNRNPSPNPHHTIKRKSVSPAPPPSNNDTRRLSGVPFGPDDYNALNPAVASTTPQANGPDYSEINGMIITHDGREVDPSDHLPMDTWAPEPEPKKPSAAPSPSARPSPAGPQSLPASGRRQLRIAGRTSTMAADGYISSDLSFDAPSPTPPASTGRNRLQKKANRQSAAPVMSGAIMSGANGLGTSPGRHSPLAPLQNPSHQDNFTPPRNLPRAQTFDYPERENHAPTYTPSPYDRRSAIGSSSGAPPIPAKVPLALPAPGGRYEDRGGYDEWGGMTGGGAGSGGGDNALLEEMRRIDIGSGSGRARRRGQGYGY